MSKILADIFMHPLRDCCWRVKESTLLARRNRAEKKEASDIIFVGAPRYYIGWLVGYNECVTQQ